MIEEIILVNEKDEEIGVMEKIEAHEKAILHRAFSVFIFDQDGQMLLQQRALSKYHSPGLWTNACCSHPRPGEITLAAAKRRLQEELGFQTELHKIFDFTYHAVFDNGLSEHEFDHVFAGIYSSDITPNADEVKEVLFMTMENIQDSLNIEPAKYTAWFQIAFPKIYSWWESNYPSNKEL